MRAIIVILTKRSEWKDLHDLTVRMTAFAVRKD